MSNFETWLRRISNGTSDRSIAAELGIQNTALSRWNREDSVPAEQVIKIARHYGASFYEGLRAAGFLTDEDLARAGITFDLERTSSQMMLEELLRRALVSERMEATPDKAEVTKIVKRLIGEVNSEPER